MAACLTPFGPAVWVYAAGLTADPEVTSRVSEWQPTSIHDVAGLLFFASALAVVAIVARRGRVVPWPSLLGLAVFFVIGLWAQRGHCLVGARGGADRRDAAATRGRAIREGGDSRPCAGSTSPSPGCSWSPPSSSRRSGARPSPARVRPAGLLTAAPPGITASLRAVTTAGRPRVPAAALGFVVGIRRAVGALRRGLPHRALHREMWAGYDRVVAGIDGWQAQLDAWGVTTVVVEADDADFAARLTEAGWTARREDTDGWVFQR